jgi:hypothetical protein
MHGTDSNASATNLLQLAFELHKQQQCVECDLTQVTLQQTRYEALRYCIVTRCNVELMLMKRPAEQLHNAQAFLEGQVLPFLERKNQEPR